MGPLAEEHLNELEHRIYFLQKFEIEKSRLDEKFEATHRYLDKRIEHYRNALRESAMKVMVD